MTSLHISLLGKFAVTDQGEPIATLNSTRLQSLLTYLLLHRQAPQLRQHLAFQLWPDSTEHQARNNLRKALHQLRRALPMPHPNDNPAKDPWLRVDSQSIQWRPTRPYTLDVAEFQARLQRVTEIDREDHPLLRQTLEAAVELYDGDLLPSCYDEWIVPVRERMRQQLLDALEQLIWLAEAERAYATAIRHANQLLQHDPLHEATYRQLMRLYMLDGNRAGALRTYQRCVTWLQRELGVEPGGEIQQAYARLQQMEIPADLVQAQPIAEAGATPLIGRQAAWQRLRGAWRWAAAGHPHFCLISGEAGIGKSRLAAELLVWAERQSVATAHTRTYAAQGALAFTPVTEWLRNPALYPKWQALAHVWLRELARLLPELLSAHPDLSPPEPLTERWQRSRLFEALARATLATVDTGAAAAAGFSEDRLLLVLDDLQWCDPDTLEWLHYLLHYHQPDKPRARLLIVGTVRAEEVADDHPLAALLLALRRDEQLTEITLGPLDRAETAALASALGEQPLDDEAAARLFQATEGSPLFVVETVRAPDWQQQLTDAGPRVGDAPAALPPKIQATIEQRLHQLSPAARDLVALAAVIGRSFSFDLLRAVNMAAENELVSCLDELWRRGIVRSQGNESYDFSHDRIREVAHAAVGPVQRPHLHRRIAAALRQLHDADPNQVAAQLAAHYDAAGATEEAITWYEWAADVQQRRFAVTEAIAHLRRALALLETLPETTERIHQKLSLLVVLSMELKIAVSFGTEQLWPVIDRIITLARRLNDGKCLYYGLNSRLVLYLARGDVGQAYGISPDMLKSAEAMGDPTIQANARYSYARVHLHLGNFQHSYREFLSAYTVHTFDAQAILLVSRREIAMGVYRPICCGNLGIVLWLLGYPEQAQTWIEEALQFRQEEEESLLQVGATKHFCAIVYRALWDVAQVQAMAEQQIEMGIRYGQNLSQLNGFNFQGWALAQQGDVAAGIDALTQGVAGFRALHQSMFQTYRLAMLAEVYLLAKDFTAAAATLDEAFAISERASECWWDAELHRLRGQLLHAQQAPTAAVERCYQQAIAIAQEQQAKSLELRATMDLARLWQAQQRTAEAHAQLAAIYDWFTEGWQTADLQAAHALLAELA